MQDIIKLKEKFLNLRQRIFSDTDLLSDSFNYCFNYSLLIEEFIIDILKNEHIQFAIVSAGSFSRRELAPYSDIDIMFITDKADIHNVAIKNCIQLLWDCGIEVSHTVREFADIALCIDDDLTSVTQFFETRFLIGNNKIYTEWNNLLFSHLDEETRIRLIYSYFNDINIRHKKYGSSPKVVEPNIKFSAGGLRDLQAVEWIYALKNNKLLSDQNEIIQTAAFINILREEKLVATKELNKLLNSYKFLLKTRIHLHLINQRKNDRLEFESQEKIVNMMNIPGYTVQEFMREYFDAAVVINRFTKTMIRRYTEQITEPVSDFLSIPIDDDFSIKANVLSISGKKELTLNDILKAFYYRGVYGASFDENLRTLIIETVHDYNSELERPHETYIFFREILRLPKNVGTTLSAMNELGVLSLIIPAFKDLNGFFQPGVYHCYTADEHTLLAINNLEKLEGEFSNLGKIFSEISNRDLLYLAVLFHDIAKPISIAGHEILGSNFVKSHLEDLGYEKEDINLVSFLVLHHLTMEQNAFRRNLDDPQTLNNFASIFTDIEQLIYLYLLTYADLSAVSPIVWTPWKSSMLYELYRKTKRMLEEQQTGEQLIYEKTKKMLEGNVYLTNEMIKDHIQSINDISYLKQYTEEEINRHVEEIEKGEDLSVFFKEMDDYTNITVITKDVDGILARLCGTLSINDLNIHDAKIFTRKDNIIIDSFNVTDFRTNKVVDSSKYDKIKSDLLLAVNDNLLLTKEIAKAKSKWWRIEQKFFRRQGKVKIHFEDHEKYLIIDVFSPDRLGLLYHITKTISELGLHIAFAKISTKGDDVVDSFYTYKKNNKKISFNEHELIRVTLIQTIEDLL